MAKSNDWFVYILECKNGKLYTGITTDIEKRFERHAAGRGAKFTKTNPPSHIIGVQSCESRSEASKLEIYIKKLTAPKKRALALAWPAKSKA